ncbi:hypothetical protein BJ878DRAFT_449832 [Calycina marina]|uniref:Cell surface protein n=1 Tax=Calycina marina TaxID=1763456 RepID=A0A9P7YV31_9HELO|nr:hypothetical protein BJ878DRAFT_449832 [Calycina marina]
MSSIVNKVKEAIHPTHHNTATTTHAEGANGPHSGRAANAADPRIDSDRDGGHLGQDTHHNTHATGGGYNSHNTGGRSNYAEGANGPHSSRAANAADPRIDSDRDGGHFGQDTHHNTHATGGGYNSHNTGGPRSNYAEGANGPHSSNVANKGDPRVDTSSYGSHTDNYGGNHGTRNTGTHGGVSSSTNAGPHNSNMSNKADPRVNSDVDGSGNRHGAHTGGVYGASGSHTTPGSGTAQNSAGPHNSDLMNKLDPRVDSDLSGGKTFGGNKTQQ